MNLINKLNISTAVTLSAYYNGKTESITLCEREALVTKYLAIASEIGIEQCNIDAIKFLRRNLTDVTTASNISLFTAKWIYDMMAG
jgi:hypothetical protein